METENQLNQEIEVTDISNSQATEQSSTTTFTQDDVNKIVADRIERERKKYERKFDGIDPEHYRKLAEAEEQRRFDEMKKAGEFDALLKETVSKKDAYYQNQLNSVQELNQKLLGEIKIIKVDQQLINEASKAKAINPEQVVALLKHQVVYKETGDVEVTDGKGNILTNEKGDIMSIGDLVNDFLNKNQHFLQASPSGTGTKVSQDPRGNIDLSKLNLKNPADRELYKKYVNSKA
jgi:hypothetical protein